MSGVNYSANPSFEVNLSGWTFSGCAAVRDLTAQPGTGSYTAKLVSTGGAPIQAAHTVSGLTPGNRYNFSYYSKAQPVSTTPFSVQGSSVDTPGTTSQGQQGYWTRQWVSFTAQAATVTLTIQSTTSNVAGDVLYLDLVKLCDGEFPGPYFDGSYPFTTWSGTPGLSSSTNSAFLDTSWQGLVESETAVVANGLCLQNHAWNISTKTGRYLIPGVRGSSTKTPGLRGSQFVRNRPVDSGLWTLSMWVLGCFPDGAIPAWGDSRRIFEKNIAQLFQHVMSVSAPIDLYAWQPDGSVRHAHGQIGGETDGTLQMGGRRAELTFIFEILEGAWADSVAYTKSGTPGAGWSNQSLVLDGLVGGSAPIENAVLTVHGPAANPRITDTTTGTWVQYNGTLGVNDVWTVDSGVWTSQVNSTGVLTNTQHYGHPRFLVIDNGNNFMAPQVTMTASGTGPLTNLTVSANRQHYTA